MAEPNGPVNPLFLRTESLQQGLDLLTLAAQELAEAGGELRRQHGLGPADQRLLQAVQRWPELTVGQLTRVLGITKQSLNRTLGGLGARELVVLRPGRRDRRERRVVLTPAGDALASELARCQRQCLAQAYRHADATAVEGFAAVLQALIADPERRGLVAAGEDGQP